MEHTIFELQKQLHALENKYDKLEQDNIKLFSLSVELANQGKTQAEIIEKLQQYINDLKNISITDSSGAIFSMTMNNFAKYVLERINPDKQVKKWVSRIKDYGFLILTIFVILFLIFQTFIQGTELKEILEVIKTLK